MDIEFKNVSKCYRVRRTEPDGLEMNVLKRLKSQVLPEYEDFWALRDLSFHAERGETLGVIGHNGAGKSTVLKILSRITAPTAGEVIIRGRIAALLEVGSGFHPELTGRENIFLSGSLLGMKRSEIVSKLDSIVDFAEIGAFLDTPVKRYSSGMYVRLGFSIAAHLDADILLLDEVLAVGDAVYQQKCLERMSLLRSRGVTMVFISHDLMAVRGVCRRVLLLQRGRLKAEGSAEEMIRLYQMSAADVGNVEHARDSDRGARVKLASLRLLDSEGRPAAVFANGSPVRVQVELEASEEASGVDVEVWFIGADQSLQLMFATFLCGDPLNVLKGATTVEFSCDDICMLPGPYLLDAGVTQRGYPRALDWMRRCAAVQIVQKHGVPGKYCIPHRVRAWRGGAGVSIS